MSAQNARSQFMEPPVLKRLFIDHPVVAFFVLAFAGSWITFLPVLLARNGAGLLPFSVPTDPFTTIGALAGPMVAAFVVTAATRGRVGLQQLLQRIGHWRVSSVWYALGLLGFPIIYVGAGIIAPGRNSVAIVLTQWPLLLTVYLPYVLVNLISTIGEEIGWVGYALPNLQQRVTPLLAAATLGIVWGLWHLPSFFITGGAQAGFSIGSFVFFLILAIVSRITWTWVFNKTRGSVLIIALLHAASNGTSVALIPHLFPITPLGAVLLTLGLIVIVIPGLIIVFTKGHLSYRPALQRGTTDTSYAAGASLKHRKNESVMENQSH